MAYTTTNRASRRHARWTWDSACCHAHWTGLCRRRAWLRPSACGPRGRRGRPAARPNGPVDGTRGRPWTPGCYLDETAQQAGRPGPSGQGRPVPKPAAGPQVSPRKDSPTDRDTPDARRPLTRQLESGTYLLRLDSGTGVEKSRFSLDAEVWTFFVVPEDRIRRQGGQPPASKDVGIEQQQRVALVTAAFAPYSRACGRPHLRDAYPNTSAYGLGGITR